jgi:hypothetical protein
MTLANYATHVYASPPESCFQSSYDYEIYKKYGDKVPAEVEGDLNDWMYGHYMEYEYEKRLNAKLHGPAKKKPISISAKEITVNGKPYMDASESKTPSGEKSYLWQGVNAKDFMDTSSKFLTSPTGSEQLFNLTVFDPVCENHLTQQLKIRIK